MSMMQKAQRGVGIVKMLEGWLTERPDPWFLRESAKLEIESSIDEAETALRHGLERAIRVLEGLRRSSEGNVRDAHSSSEKRQAQAELKRIEKTVDRLEALLR